MKAFCICLLLLFSTLSYGQSLDISGRYRCTGEDFLNNKTFDEPTLVIKKGGTYFFTWINKNIEFNGTAILLGKTVSSLFWAKNIDATPGIVTYEVLPNGDLKGKWTIKDGQRTGDEYCKKLP